VDQVGCLIVSSEGEERKEGGEGRRKRGHTQSPRSKHNLAKYMAEAANILGVNCNNRLSKHPISIKYFDTVLV